MTIKVRKERYTTVTIILSLTLEKKTSEHHIPIIPVDAEAVSVTSQTTERVRCTLDKCRDKNFLTDTFKVDHLLSKLSSSSIGVLACMSPIDSVGLSFFKKYLKNRRSKIRIFYAFLSATVCISKAM